MSVKLYLNIASLPYAPGTPKGAWNDITSTTTVLLGTDPFGTGITSVEKNEATIISPYSVLMLRGVSSKLQTQTISGTLDLILAVAQDILDADFYWHIHAYVTQGNTETLRGTLLNNYTEASNEWPVASQVGQGHKLAAPVALSSVNAISGDRIVVELGYISRNVLTGTKRGELWYGSKLAPLFEPVVDLSVGSNSSTSQAGTITFSQDILFESVPSQISHVINQALDEAASASARNAHTLIQTTERTLSVARIAHILIQVAQGTPVPVAPGTEMSGIYTIEPNKTERHDSYYNSIEKKIPDPTIKTALIGE